MRSGRFSGADFTDAILRDADLGCARLDGAILCGADLRAIDIGEASLQGAIAERATIWPAGFNPEAHGVLMSP